MSTFKVIIDIYQVYYLFNLDLLKISNIILFTRKYHMKLLYSVPSPFARKVLVLAHETGVIDQINTVDCALTPIAPDAKVVKENPVGKIPTLLLEDGTSLFDSRVICEYLDGLHEGPKMFPTEGITRWKTLTLQALADGILDAAILVRYETFLRPESYRWPEWIEGQMLKVYRSLDQLESDVGSLKDSINMGKIGVGCALGYLDFRFSNENWRARCPKLAGWYSEFEARPSMQATQPA